MAKYPPGSLWTEHSSHLMAEKRLHINHIKILGSAILLLTLLANVVVLTFDDRISSLSHDGKSNDHMDLDTATETSKKNKDSIIGVSPFGGNSPDGFSSGNAHAPACSEPLDETMVSFTLVSQLSYGRLWMIRHHCERWGDSPISIVVITDKTVVDVKAELISMGCSEEQMTLQTVSKTKYYRDGTQYPVNLMRNLALSAVKTSHIVYADVDFLPSADLYSILSNQAIKKRLASDSKLAVVIPAFQMNLQCNENENALDCMRRLRENTNMVRHQEDLIAIIGTGEASRFDPSNEGGHGSTMYHTWFNQKTGTFVDLPCIASNRYEPYLALRYCSELPPFQEGFTGYGKNKITWVMHLRKVGYKFSRIGGAFFIHFPHFHSKARDEWSKLLYEVKTTDDDQRPPIEIFKKAAHKVDLQKFSRARTDKLFLDFKKWLNENVDDKSRTPMCANMNNDDYTLLVHQTNG